MRRMVGGGLVVGLYGFMVIIEISGELREFSESVCRVLWLLDTLCSTYIMEISVRSCS